MKQSGLVIKWLFGIVFGALILGWITDFRNLISKEEAKHLIYVERDKQEVINKDVSNRVQVLEQKQTLMETKLQKDITDIKINLAKLIGRLDAERRMKDDKKN